MTRTITIVALACGLALGGCDSFDPLDKFQDWDIMGGGKPAIKGQRRDVFPSGVPGVPQGVPPEMVKGYQPPAEEPPPVIEAKQPKQKQPQKKAAAPRKQPRQQVEQAPPAEPMQQAPAARTTTTTQPVQGQGGFQTMPGAQPTWPSGAQPVPQR